jgi:GDPmannose 4,6-dehydratase
LDKGYDVHGLIRRSSSFNRERIEHLHGDKNFHLYYGDLSDTGCLCHLMKKIIPDEVYHLGSMSHVQVSGDIPEYTFDTNGVGTVRLLEAIRLADIDPCVYNACTSEVFGGSNCVLNEESMMHPRSPYAISKLYSYWIMRYYRDAYGMKTWNGILFNHESPRRGENFISRKITLSIKRILEGKQSVLEVGNIDACRDWGFAPDYVQAMYLMLQSGKPDDFVISTGVVHSVREFIEQAFDFVGITIRWDGQGVDEVGNGFSSQAHIHTTRKYVSINPMYYRPCDVGCLVGDSSKAERVLGWKPVVGFEELVRLMMVSELDGVTF